MDNIFSTLSSPFVDEKCVYLKVSKFCYDQHDLNLIGRRRDRRWIMS